MMQTQTLQKKFSKNFGQERLIFAILLLVSISTTSCTLDEDCSTLEEFNPTESPIYLTGDTLDDWVEPDEDN